MTLTKAVLLAAGRGTRMQSLTDNVAKPMLLLHGRPILAHLIDNLRSVGVREFFVVTGYRAEQLESYLAAQPAIVFARQTERNGTARAASLAREFTGDDPFFLSYGDILTETATYPVMGDRLGGAEAVLAVKEVDDPHQGAAVYVENDRVTRIVEKPPPGTSTTRWNSAGIYCFRRSLFDHLPRVALSPRGEYELTDAVSLLLASGALVRHYAIPGWWRDIGRPDDLAAAERWLKDRAAASNGIS